MTSNITNSEFNPGFLGMASSPSVCIGSRAMEPGIFFR
jgi:hypothetical protein